MITVEAWGIRGEEIRTEAASSQERRPGPFGGPQLRERAVPSARVSRQDWQLLLALLMLAQLLSLRPYRTCYWGLAPCQTSASLGANSHLSVQRPWDSWLVLVVHRDDRWIRSLS
jgi:hypothetical protein